MIYIILYLLLLILCSYVIAKSCDVFESSTNYLGRNLSDGVRGATLCAIGSSMPELLTMVFFLAFATVANLGRDFAASVGTDTGSAIFNSVVIPMLVIWMVVVVLGLRGVKLSKKVILRDGIFLILAEILLLFLLSSDYITIWHGLVLIMFYLVYLSYTLLSMSKDGKKCNFIERKDRWFEVFQFKSETGRVLRSWLLLTLSVIVMAIACAGLVEGCKSIAVGLGINPLFVALILVAAVTSVPDTIISIKDARQGNYDDSLSNVLGSNIFDITFSIGFPLTIFLMITNQSIDFVEAGQTLIDIRIILLVVTTLTLGIYYFSKEMKLKHVLFLGCIYVAFILYVFGLM